MEMIVSIAILIVVIWAVKIFLSNGGERLIERTAKTAAMNVEAWNAKAEANAAKLARELSDEIVIVREDSKAVQKLIKHLAKKGCFPGTDKLDKALSNIQDQGYTFTLKGKPNKVYKLEYGVFKYIVHKLHDIAGDNMNNPKYIFRMTHINNITRFVHDGFIYAPKYNNQPQWTISHDNIVHYRNTTDKIAYYFSPITAMAFSIARGNVEVKDARGRSQGDSSSDDIVFMVMDIDFVVANYTYQFTDQAYNKRRGWPR